MNRRSQDPRVQRAYADSALAFGRAAESDFELRWEIDCPGTSALPSRRHRSRSASRRSTRLSPEEGRAGRFAARSRASAPLAEQEMCDHLAALSPARARARVDARAHHREVVLAIEGSR